MDHPPLVEPAPVATPAQIATDLVTQYPGSTISELLCYTPLAKAGHLALNQGRQALVPALHAAEANGTLIRGPMRLCQQGGGRVNTWLPAKAPSFGGDVSALIGLEDLIARAAEQQAAEDSVVAEPAAQELA